MSWPEDAPDGTGAHALLIALSPEGMIQDLGPFRTGRGFETDLLPHTAVLCRADPLWRPVLDRGRVRFAFEGNANGAVNLTRFADRVVCAAGRLSTRAPNIAYGSAAPDQIRPLARYHLDRHVILKVLDPEGLAAWAGEPVDEICPAHLLTPCDRIEEIRHLFPLVRDALAQDPNGVLAWTLLNGQVLVREHPEAPITLWSVEDPGFVRIARGLDLPEDRVRRLFGRAGWPEESGPEPL
jgi:hypothetical protein